MALPPCRLDQYPDGPAFHLAGLPVVELQHVPEGDHGFRADDQGQCLLEPVERGAAELRFRRREGCLDHRGAAVLAGGEGAVALRVSLRLCASACPPFASPPKTYPRPPAPPLRCLPSTAQGRR